MKMLRITLEGKTYEVGVELLDEPASAAPVPHSVPLVQQNVPSAAAMPAAMPAAAPVPPAAAGCRNVICPMAGKVFKCLVKPGDSVTLHQVVLVLDAMKMETPVVAPTAGIVRAVLVKEGDSVDEGTCLLQIES